MRPPASLRGGLRRGAAPAVVLATGVLAAAGSALYVSRGVDAQQDARFNEVVAASAEALQRRMDAYVAKLRSTRGLFEIRPRDPDPEDFRRFVASFELSRYYPGVQGVGWAKALRPDEVAGHEAAVRTAGDPAYRVWPGGERAFRSSIVMLEPLDWRNRRAIGYDMFSEPTRRAAMERARDTGEVAASGKVELVQEAGEQRQAGFLMYLAVYERPPRSLEERRELLRGWVYAPFRAADLLHGTLGPERTHAVGLSVFDAEHPTADALLHGAAAAGPAFVSAERHLTVGGRTWTLRYAATGAFASRTERALPGAVFAAGLAVALLLFAVVRQDARARARAERSAFRASFLAEAGKLLSSSAEYARALPEIAALAAERVADGCLVYLVEPGGPEWIVGHPDPEIARRAAEALAGAELDPADSLGAGAALRTGGAQLREGMPQPDGSPLQRAASVMRAAASLAVPLFARGHGLGAIVLLARVGRFGGEDVRLAEDLGRLVSATVDTSRLYLRAQEAVAARDEFLSIASHELKTPLTSLVLNAGSLRSAARRGDLESVARKAEVTRRNVDRLTRLVSSLLDISRISAGRLDLELEEVDFADVVREVVARFEDEARRAGCAVRLSVGGPAVGRWDRLRLDQVATNLLSNAIKYGRGKPVEVTLDAEAERVTLTVRDHGIGISAADQRRIFQRFERAVSKRNYGGFGLGLWIVRQVVESLGGTVRVESTPGEGSTFEVELARAAPAETRPPGGPAEAPAP
ncbi:MAG TPA: CHASE domain-containing protein [Anaeromyxobacter sp.]|nr:CHASE domain-containing protein [Anaeromyxobacter sp.]